MRIRTEPQHEAESRVSRRLAMATFLLFTRPWKEASDSIHFANRTGTTVEIRAMRGAGGNDQLTIEPGRDGWMYVFTAQPGLCSTVDHEAAFRDNFKEGLILSDTRGARVHLSAKELRAKATVTQYAGNELAYQVTLDPDFFSRAARP